MGLPSYNSRLYRNGGSPINNPTTLQDRIHIGRLAQEDALSDKQIALKMNRSLYTVRKWRRRASSPRGRGALASEMGRPKKGALSTFPEAIRDLILEWREEHPGWGPKTLRAELENHPAFVHQEKKQELPSRSSIARFLKERGLSGHYERHSALPTPPRKDVSASHHRWQMDAQGNQHVPDLPGTVAMIDLVDCYSRLRVLSYPCLLRRAKSHPTTEAYKTLLRLAFCDWGLPKELQVDHESVFFDSASKSPFPTRLHLWLEALGVELLFSRTRRPTDQALIERTHRLWQEQVLEGQRFGSWHSLYEASLKRRDFLNHHLPCATLGERAPLVAFPEARHSGRHYHPELESRLMDLDRVDAFLAKGRWFRLASKDATVCLGGHFYYVGAAHRGAQLEIGYEPSQRRLLFYDEAGEEVARRPIKGISREALLGEMEPYVNLPFFQLPLPFSWAEEGMARVCETMVA